MIFIVQKPRESYKNEDADDETTKVYDKEVMIFSLLVFGCALQQKTIFET